MIAATTKLQNEISGQILFCSTSVFNAIIGWVFLFFKVIYFWGYVCVCVCVYVSCPMAAVVVLCCYDHCTSCSRV
jgi:hypothetical protein